MANLLRETLCVMERNGVSPKDGPIYVMDNESFCFWDEFAIVADNYNYDSGFGSAEVNEDLKIIGYNWWMERREYDGAEWWEFKKRPQLGTQRHTTQIDLRCNFNRRV